MHSAAIDRRVDQPLLIALGEIEVLAELRSVAKCGQRSAQRLRLGLFDVISKIGGRFVAPARCGTTLRDTYPRPE